MRRRAELIFEHHTRVEPIADFVNVGGFPLNRTRSGKLVVVAGMDQLVWTKQANDLVAVMDEQVKRGKLANFVELRITGTATPRAREGLRERGWKLVENIAP